MLHTHDPAHVCCRNQRLAFFNPALPVWTLQGLLSNITTRLRVPTLATWYLFGQSDTLQLRIVLILRLTD
jgi:hypothetical protein